MDGMDYKIIEALREGARTSFRKISKRVHITESAKKGMIPKIEVCQRAVQGGVERVHIISGTATHVLLLEILTERGIGTMIERGK